TVAHLLQSVDERLSADGAKRGLGVVRRGLILECRTTAKKRRVAHLDRCRIGQLFGANIRELGHVERSRIDLAERIASLRNRAELPVQLDRHMLVLSDWNITRGANRRQVATGYGRGNV